MQALRHKPKSRGKRADQLGEARISDFPNYQPDRIDQPAQVLCDREFRPSLGGSKTGPVSGVWAVQCFSCAGDDMTQTRINDPRTPEELEALLDKANGVIAELDGQIAKKDATIERLIEENVELRAEIKQLRLEMEAVGAGGVSLMGGV